MNISKKGGSGMIDLLKLFELAEPYEVIIKNEKRFSEKKMFFIITDGNNHTSIEITKKDLHQKDFEETAMKILKIALQEYIERK